MKPEQTDLPFSNAPIIWLEPVECSFGQLRDVVAAAERAGFVAVRMAVTTGGYRVQFQRNHFATKTQPQDISLCKTTSKDSLKILRPARRSCTPGSKRFSTLKPVSVSLQENHD